MTDEQTANAVSGHEIEPLWSRCRVCAFSMARGPTLPVVATQTAACRRDLTAAEVWADRVRSASAKCRQAARTSPSTDHAPKYLQFPSAVTSTTSWAVHFEEKGCRMNPSPLDEREPFSRLFCEAFARINCPSPS